MPRKLLACLVVVAAFSSLPASQARDRVSPPVVVHCTVHRHCLHVFRVGPSTSATRHVAWDSRPRFTRPNVAISLSYSPQLASDQDVRTAPINDCGIHFWLNGRFNGVATRCGDGRLPLHVQIANVNNQPLRIVFHYWASLYQPTVLPAARR
jgi:hypothetical protein